MEPIKFLRNPDKMRAKAFLVGAIALAVALAGLWLMMTNRRPEGARQMPWSNYIKTVTGACLLGGGGAGAVAGTLGLMRLGGKPLLQADEHGVSIDPGVEGSRTHRWDNIAQVQAVDDGKRKVIVLKLTAPDNYLRALSGREKKPAEKLMRTYGSPVAVSVAPCDESPAQVAQALNERLQAAKTSA